MAIPVLLDSKLAFVKGEEGEICFQTSDICSVVYYRLKKASVGTVLKTEQVNENALPQRLSKKSGGGASHIYSFYLTFNELFEGASSALLSISTDKKSWSPSIQISLISKPRLNISFYQDLQAFQAHINGELTFSQAGETDFLDSYRINLLDQTGAIKEATGWLRAYSYNTINYTLKNYIENNKTYNLTVEYRTDKGYTGITTSDLAFNSRQDGNYLKFEDTGGQIVVQDGKVCIEKWALSGAAQYFKSTTIYLDRADSVSGYDHWKTIQYIPIERNDQSAVIKIKILAYDKYLDYGVGYKYRLRAAYKANDTDYETSVSDDTVFSIDSEDITLDAPDLSYLTIRFNPTISSYKYNVKEAVTPTIGGVYPVVRRNGKQQYRTFSIGGLISSEGESKNNPLQPMEIVSSHLTGYSKDTMRERIFREKVLEFLQKNEVRLFRSPIEGMMLVRLTNISLTPNEQLGRRLWSFSAQGVEIDTCNSISFQEYGFKIPDGSHELIAYGDLVVENAKYSDGELETVVENDGNETYLVAKLTWFTPDKAPLKEE